MKPTVWSAGEACSIRVSYFTLTTPWRQLGQVAGWAGMQGEEGHGSADSGPDSGLHSLVASLGFPAQAGSGTADGASVSPQHVFD